MMVVRIIVSTLLLLWVVNQTGILKAETQKQLLVLIERANPAFICLTLVISLLMELSSTLKWQMLLASRDIHVSFIQLFRHYMLGKAFSQILPTSTGGDLVRIHALGKQLQNFTDPIASVGFERFTGMVTIVTLAGLSMLLNKNLAVSSLITLLAVALVVIGVVVLSVTNEEWLPREIVPGIKRFASKLEKLQSSVAHYKNDSRAIGLALMNSFIFCVLVGLNVWSSASAFGSVSFFSMLAITPLILLISSVPLSLGNLGLLEISCLYTFSLCGLSPELALATALLIRCKCVIFALLTFAIVPLLPASRTSNTPLAEVPTP